MIKFTKYEKARVIGARALQVAMGAPLLIKLKKEDFVAINFDPVQIAKKEFDAGVLPITVKRPLPYKDVDVV
jgi:DNA-directed RNA polymerase subunit K